MGKPNSLGVLAFKEITATHVYVVYNQGQVACIWKPIVTDTSVWIKRGYILVFKSIMNMWYLYNIHLYVQCTIGPDYSEVSSFQGYVK